MKKKDHKERKFYCPDKEIEELDKLIHRWDLRTRSRLIVCIFKWFIDQYKQGNVPEKWYERYL